jgi:hypothetical protein
LAGAPDVAASAVNLGNATEHVPQKWDRFCEKGHAQTNK